MDPGASEQRRAQGRGRGSRSWSRGGGFRGRGNPDGRRGGQAGGTQRDDFSRPPQQPRREPQGEWLRNDADSLPTSSRGFGDNRERRKNRREQDFLVPESVPRYGWKSRQPVERSRQPWSDRDNTLEPQGSSIDLDFHPRNMPVRNFSMVPQGYTPATNLLRGTAFKRDVFASNPFADPDFVYESDQDDSPEKVDVPTLAAQVNFLMVMPHREDEETDEDFVDGNVQTSSSSKNWREKGGGSRSEHRRDSENRRRAEEQRMEEERREREEEARIRLEEAVDEVYWNDYLMMEIISHVTNLQDRIKLELACDRLWKLSHRAPYRFATGGDSLTINFTTLDDQATVQLGSVARRVPILTLETRRFDGMSQEMSPQLRQSLSGIASRFARHVRCISLGGTPDFYRHQGVPQHQLIITIDLLESLVARFNNVTSFSLQNCGFDDRAIAYCSRNAEFHNWASRLEGVALHGIWYDSAGGASAVVKLLGPSLRSFALSMFSCQVLGQESLAAIGRAGVNLDKFSLTIDEGCAGNAAEVFTLIKRASAVSNELHLKMLTPIGGVNVNAALTFSSIRKLPEIRNITELRIQAVAVNRQGYESLAFLFSQLGHFPCLRVFSTAGWREVRDGYRDPQFMNRLPRALCKGLLDCGRTLKELRITHLPLNLPHHESCALVASFPSTLEKLELISVPFDDRIVYEFLERSYRLEWIKLRQVRRVTARCVVLLLSGGQFARLKHVDCDIPVNSSVARRLADGKATPYLEYASLSLKQRLCVHDEEVKQIKSQFGNLYLQQVGSPDAKQTIEVYRRIAYAPFVPPTFFDLSPEKLLCAPPRPPPAQRRPHRRIVVEPWDPEDDF